MKKIITCLLTMLGLNTACSQSNFENVDVNDFSSFLSNDDVVLLDVRTPEEFAESHIAGAINIDIKADDFVSKATQQLPQGKTVAVYCRSGKRSAKAASMLVSKGYSVVNLKGGIIAWKSAGKPVSNVDYEIDTFTTKSGKTVKFHALMHGSIRIECEDMEI